MQAAAETANDDGHGKNDVRGILEDDKAETNVTAEEDAALNPSAEPLRATMPTRRVGKVNIGNAPEVAAQTTSAPPRRRAASVFGTRGREIVSYPEAAMASAPAHPVAVIEELPDDQECKTGTQDNAAIAVQERESSETEAPGDVQQTNHDGSGEKSTERRVYVRFKDLPRETGAAYVHVLMGLFADNPGDDAVALVFDDSREVIEIAAPEGVDYDEVSEVVQNIVGEDAVIEVIEQGGR